MREGSCLPRFTTANVIGVVLFLSFVAPALFRPPFPLPRISFSDIGSGKDASVRTYSAGFVQVAKNSHAYLRPEFPGKTEANFGANVSAGYSEYIAEHAEEVGGALALSGVGAWWEFDYGRGNGDSMGLLS